MKLKNILVCILPIVVGVIFSVDPLQGLAAESGQVGQDAVIEFYTDKSEPKPTQPSTEPQVEKPKGRFPSTGEVVQRSLILSGCILAVAVFLFFVLKKRKTKEEDEK
ncbi:MULTISPECIES: LPXTG cell wall anchor domain-containing protein [unclassified Enterococcus]|uniref:LPXTG cell wall anchor domain-containing protein n=1 Tax=unclassified Enterococcus TaxID=2608891 RepID=UPI001CE082FE|nr:MULTISPECIES: LPXTG cell wall anchor domain-containing protein [unclassified Enterococcus]MCA5011428.1 LPXTG cell wall anchor domain-containing protein [Enterococcus sp. S23]MCA5015130.1 LPXTG cell wall anchor domain-containing protein [Enterococcus sp. S22(2020)]